MNADQSAGALPVQIKITDVKLFAGPVQLCGIATVDSTSQTKLDTVGDLQSVIVVLRFKHCQHWSENFFLFNGAAGFGICNHGRLDEIPLFPIRTATGNDAAPLTLSLFDIAIDRLERFLIDYRAQTCALLSGIG